MEVGVGGGVNYALCQQGYLLLMIIVMSTPDVVVTNLKVVATGNDPYQIEL